MPFISGRADRRYSPPARACKPDGKASSSPTLLEAWSNAQAAGRHALKQGQVTPRWGYLACCISSVRLNSAPMTFVVVSPSISDKALGNVSCLNLKPLARALSGNTRCPRSSSFVS